MQLPAGFWRKTFLACLAASLLALPGQAEDFSSISGKTPFFNGWTIKQGSDPAAVSEWKPVSTNKPVQVEDPSGWYTLKNEFTIRDANRRSRYWLFLSKFPSPCIVRLNGTDIGERGKFPPGYFVNISTPFSVFLPPGLIRQGGENVIEVVANFKGPVFFMTECFIGDEAAWRFDTGISELFNARIYMVFFAICMFAGIFFALQFFYRMKEGANLLYALSCLFIAISFLEIGVPTPVIPFEILRPLGKASLVISLAFLLDFFIVFFDTLNKPAFRIPFYAAASAFAIPILFTSTETMLMDVFSWSIWPMLMQILVILFIAIRAVAGKKEFSMPILIGTLLGVGLGVHDIVYRALGAEPFAWMQGIGFFVLMCSLFLSLAVRSARTLFSLEAYARIVEQKTEDLSKISLSISRFVPKEFLDLLEKKSIKDIHLGDHAEGEMTILFIDIHGFTSLSETMNPQQNFTFLNSYFRVMVPIIREEGGIINKYLGDAIMALFPSGPAAAMRTAAKLRKELTAYNNIRRIKGRPPIETGIGIHSGTVIMGMVGEPDRMDSTVISDAVTLAAKLESLTKIHKTPVIVSETVKNGIDEDTSWDFKRIGTIAAKSHTPEIPFYEALFTGVESFIPENQPS